MIVSDMSAALPAESKKLEDELVRLRRLYHQWDKAGRSDRDCNLLLYLMRRAKRPIYHLLKMEYERLWPAPKNGPKRSYSYFFPEHTTNAIWYRATDRLKAEVE